MISNQNEQLSKEDVIAITIQASDIQATVVGGQAINFWGEFFWERAQAELAEYAPFTSKDIDYYGTKAAAQELACKLGGKAIFPTPGDNTPNSALVLAEINGRSIEIDFLGTVLGVLPSEVDNGAILITSEQHNNGIPTTVSIRVLHPFLCLKSRVANMITLRRTDDVARRQYAASFIILREYILWNLEQSNHREAARTLIDMFK